MSTLDSESNQTFCHRDREADTVTIRTGSHDVAQAGLEPPIFLLHLASAGITDSTVMPDAVSIFHFIHADPFTIVPLFGHYDKVLEVTYKRERVPLVHIFRSGVVISFTFASRMITYHGRNVWRSMLAMKRKESQEETGVPACTSSACPNDLTSSFWSPPIDGFTAGWWPGP